MKKCKGFAGYTNHYTYLQGTKQILMERIRHRSKEVTHRNTLTFATPAAAARYFDTRCGA